MNLPDKSPPEAACSLGEQLRREREEMAAGIPLLNGIHLFEMELADMRMEIRSQFPRFTFEQVEAELDRRVAIQRDEDERGFYTRQPPH